MTGGTRFTSTAEVAEGKEDKFNRCSKSVNCPMKLKLGEIFGRRDFTRLEEKWE